MDVAVVRLVDEAAVSVVLYVGWDVLPVYLLQGALIYLLYCVNQHVGLIYAVVHLGSGVLRIFIVVGLNPVNILNVVVILNAVVVRVCYVIAVIVVMEIHGIAIVWGHS